jgi:putative spermidine/putrescine transport system substrate-binding protein
MVFLAVGVLAVVLASTAWGQSSHKASNDRAHSRAGQQTLVVASLGGSYQDAQSKAFIQPFEKATGIKVTQANEDGTVGALKTQVQAKNVQWDVVDLGSIDAQTAAKQGLLEPINYSVVTAGKQLLPGNAQKYAVGSIYSTNVIAWKKGQWGANTPTTPADFFNLSKFPGGRALPGYSPVCVLEFALLADGVPQNKLYPLDVNRAFKKLDTIKNKTVFFKTNEQGLNLVSSGQAGMSYPPNGRVYDAMHSGQNLDYSWAGGCIFVDYWVIPKGAKHVAAAMKFIQFASQAQNQAKMASLIPYGGTNKNGTVGLSQARKSVLPTAAQNLKHQFKLNESYWISHYAKLATQWQNWLLH